MSQRSETRVDAILPKLYFPGLGMEFPLKRPMG
jgi:hypothetical protein